MRARVELTDGEGEDATTVVTELECDEEELTARGGLQPVLSALGTEAIRLELERADEATRAPGDASALG